MKELIEAINRLAAAQEESNEISKLNTELLQNVLSTVQVTQQQNAKLLNQQPFSNPTIKDRQIMQQMTKIE